MATQAQFIGTPTPYAVKISVANTARDGTGTLETLVTGAAGPIGIFQINAKAEGTTAAGMLRLFLFNAATAYLLREMPTLAVTPSSTVASASVTFFFPGGIAVPAGWTLQVGTNNAEVWDVVALASGSY